MRFDKIYQTRERVLQTPRSGSKNEAQPSVLTDFAVFRNRNERLFRVFNVAS